jgi:pyruvate dehydrogenase E2 component (dihydrolipoamide acetyltransferase)
MLREFKLSDLGEGVHEGEVLVVLVKSGQEVKEGDIILEVETDKAAVEIPSPYTGTVQEILVKPGDLVHVGDVMMAFSNGGVAEPKGPEPEKRPAPKEEAAAAPAAPQPERRKGPVPASPATRRLARELGVDLRQVTASGPQGLVTAEDVRAAAEKAAPAEAERVQVEGPAVEKPATRAAIDVPPLPDFSK